jgi:hypothetical protein
VASRGGNYIDMETGESFWISSVKKKNYEDRHWAGSGKVLIEHAAVSDYLKAVGTKTLDLSQCEVTNFIRPTDLAALSKLANLKYAQELELNMKRTVPMESASARIDEKIKELGDWRGKMLAKVREIIHEAHPEIVEEWKWVKATNPGTPVFSHGGIVCTGETYKNVVKMTFAKGAALKDPSGLFNSSLEGNVRRAIDIHEGEKVDEAALKDLIRAAVALNLTGKNKPKSRRASSKRAD